MKRILVVGISGAGKTMLSSALAARLGLPLIHLDKEFWLPNWTAPVKEAWRCKVGRLAAEPAWVMDGNFGSTLDMRIAAADTVIWLDYGRIGCVLRALRRVAKHHGRTRPDMAAGCNERLDLAFLRYIWSFPKRHRPNIVAALERRPETVRVIRLTRPGQARRLLAELGTELGTTGAEG